MRRPLALLSLLALTNTACPSTVDPPDPGPTDPVPTDAFALDPVPAGQGFQYITRETEVPQGVEQQDCYFFKAGDIAAANGMSPTEPINLHRIQISQRDGSHHMNIYRVRTIVGLDPANGEFQPASNGSGPCFNSANWADWPLLANTQQDGTIDWTYPEGVANVIQPEEWLMLQSHFVNASTQKTPQNYGRVWVNFWVIPKEQVKHELGTIFATKQSIRVCTKNPTPTFDGTCNLNNKTPVQIIGANGHFHSRGKEFRIYAWDGMSLERPPEDQRFYTSEVWDDPPMKRSPELDLTLPAGSGIWYTCNYEWTPPPVGCAALDEFDKKKYSTPDRLLDCCYTFGPQVDQNEHCNAFIYYYPKQDNVNCF
ncbi:MAG TPA: hypothetical protein VFZ09_06515 [Archangium sp.]|uniref:hypothetical protein n=1 Tax=Archangium sp. TaxID=1872627 RepID=UPI002E37B635|nr:hypothetical protein [Archangium sp.]HEX5745877.1 hypothetical protein [Archangium sp.]